MDPLSIGTLGIGAGTLVGPLLNWLGTMAQDKVGPGMITKWAGRLTELAFAGGFAAFVGQVSQGKLSAHDAIPKASRVALKNGLLWMARELGEEPEASARGSVLAAGQQGLPIDPMLFQSPEHRAWVAALKKLARNERKLRELDHRNLDGSDVEKMLQTRSDETIAAELHTRVRKWLADNLGDLGDPPEQLDDFLGRGWLLSDGKRMTLYQAWCWYFRETINEEPKAFNSFVSNAIANVLDEPAEPFDFSAAFGRHLERPLGELLGLAAATLRLTEQIDQTVRTVDRTAQHIAKQVDKMARGFGFEADDPLRNASLEDLLAAETLQGPQQRLLDALLDPHHERDPDSKSILAAIACPVTGTRSYLLHRYARGCRQQGTAVWLDSGEIRLNAEFVDPQLLVRQFADESPAQRFDSLGAVLLKGAGVDAWVLAGDAGGGKTTLLRNHEMETIRRLLTRLESGTSPDDCELCVWIRLAAYRRKQMGHEQHWPDCETWLREQWALQMPASTGLSLPLLRKHFRVRFLLDGINEIEPSVDTSIRHQAMLKFREWVVDERRNGQSAPVFSVRRHDRGVAPVSSDELRVQQVDLVRWSPERIEQFCRQGGNAHDALWDSLKADPALLTLCQIPFNLAAHCALHDRQYLAGTRADLFLGLVWLSLKREHGRGELSKAELLTSRDHEKISDEEHWLMRRLLLPTEGPLLRALEEQARAMAYEMQVAYKDAALFAWPGFNRSAWLAAVQALGVVEVRMDDDGEQFAFAHQLWQDFFVALHLLGHAEAFTELEPPALPLVADQLASLKGDQPLPKPEAVKLEEAVKLAGQLARQPANLIERVAAVNLSLAGRALATCGPRVTPATLDRVRTELLRRSRDARVDVRLRIEAAEALGLVGDLIRYEKVTSADAAPYLLARNDAEPEAGHRAGWIDVRADDYAIGSPATLPDLDPDETGPDGQPLRVRLSAFEIAFAPVTNAEYLLFIQAGGYADDRWWPGDVPARWKRGELRDDEGRRWQMRRYEALVDDFEDGMNRFFFWRSPGNLEYAKALSLLSREQVQQDIDSAYPYSGKVPAFMDVPSFGNPLQPVVGLSLFEAEAYCRWLSAQCRTVIRLPTEAEWEVAVRGRQRREWPWGDEAPGLDHLNADVLHLQRPTPIGVFPRGNTPEGMVDAAGNAWEWTTSAFTADGLRLDSVNGVAAPEAMRTVRGGAYHFAPEHCRPAYRFRCHPLLRHKAVGFRIVRETSGANVDGGNPFG